MGHILFLVLHVLAVLFGFVALFLTIPLHLIYANSRRTRKLTERAVDPEGYAAERFANKRALVVLAVAAGLGYLAHTYNERETSRVDLVSLDGATINKNISFAKSDGAAESYRSQPPGYVSDTAGDQDVANEIVAAVDGAVPAVGAAKVKKQASHWAVHESKNPVDDSPSVVMTVEAQDGKSAWGERPEIYIKCSSNRTEFYVTWGDYLGSETTVTARVGEKKAVTKPWLMSTDKKASFYPSKKITFIKSLFDADSLLLKTTPYNASPITAIFNVSGLAEKILPLRTACNW